MYVDRWPDSNFEYFALKVQYVRIGHRHSQTEGGRMSPE